MKRASILALAIVGVLIAANATYAQTAAQSGASDARTEAALKDLSAVYGSPVVRVDQAKAICNQEQYFLDCAEIGKKHDLFDDKRALQVDVILSELKGKVVDDIKQCDSVDCLVQVATSVARKFNAASPAAARAVELTPQKVSEKKDIVETAKAMGVDFEDCRTMNPDDASVELLRACAKLAKSESVQKYVPQEIREQVERADPSIALRESLAKGEIKCGDGTLNGCGNFCLKPSAEARKQGVAAIPQVCNQIAERFFGKSGVEELKRAYTSVQDTYNTLAGRSEKLVFVTADGRKLADQASIGQYMEEAGRRGDVKAVEQGMDFLVRNNLVTEKDRDFALTMVGKIRDRGQADFDFDKCRTNPELCADLVPEGDREQFAAMSQIEKVMRAEMEKRGIADPSRCEFDPAIGESCMAAAKSALPQIEALAEKSKEAGFIVADIKQKIRFGEEGIEARKRVEKSFQSGEFAFGEQKFRAMGDLEQFCKDNPERCLAETTKAGIFSRDVASEKYGRAIEYRYNEVPLGPPERTMDTVSPPPYSDQYDNRQYDRPDDNRYIAEPQQFDRAEIMKRFEKWLDNPQGPPPVPVQPPAPYRPYDPYPRPYQEQPYNYYDRTATTAQQRYITCASYPPPRCRAGEYSQESVNEFGCNVYSPCIPISTRTQPPTTDPNVRQICPALPTVDRCPAGEVKTVSFSSPECGTYYSCVPVRNPEAGIRFPYTLPNGKIVVSIEEARAYCRQYGPGSGQGIAGDCEAKFGVVYNTNPPPPAQDGRSFRNGLYFTPSFMSCMERAGSRDSAMRVQNWLSSGAVPPPWSELSSKGQNDVAACERETNIPTDTTDAGCARFGSGWHTMDSSGNCFNPSMSEYRTPGGTLERCENIPVYGCATRTSEYDTPYRPQEGQREQTWNNLGLRSWVRTDASASRIESLKNACAGVSSRANVWTGGAGDQTSQDFGMPDTEKCRKAALCTSSQYFNGSECAAESTTTGTTNTSNVPYGQREQIWNGLGLRSSIRADASSTRIESLKSACSGVSAGANVWTPEAGNSASSDFGMPDADKCRRAAACASTQYFNGSECVSGSGSGSGSGGGGGGGTAAIQRCFYPNATKNGTYPGYTVWCERDYYNCREGSPSGAPVSLSGLSLGAPSTCESGWSGGSTAGACGSGQYWNGTNCVASSQSTSQGDANSCPGFAYSRWDRAGARYCQLSNSSSCQYGYPQYLTESNYAPANCPSDSATTQTTQTQTQTTQTGTASGSCSSELIGLLDSGCHNMGSAWFNGAMTRYVMPGTTVARDCAVSSIAGCSGGGAQTSSGSCTSGQYWNGSSCVTSSSTYNAPSSCGSGQYWNGSSCVTSSTYTAPSSCGSGQYWNGSSCVTSSSYSSDPQTACSQAGGTWSSSSNYCQMPGSTQSGSGSCGSGQYWNGSSCVTSSASGAASSCGSGQYWNGSACVATSPSDTTTSCGSGQYWNGSSCVSSSPTQTTTSCPSDQYWNGSSCVTSSPAPAPAPTPTPTTTSEPTPTPTPTTTSEPTPTPAPTPTTETTSPPPATTDASAPISYFCPGDHGWNGSYCTLAQKSAVERYTANALSAFLRIFGW